MGKTNYELTLERMPAEFLKYDQRRMIDGFHLEHDAAYLYLPFLARRYRVGRQSGVIEWTENGTDYFPGGFEDGRVVLPSAAVRFPAGDRAVLVVGRGIPAGIQADVGQKYAPVSEI